MKKSAVLVIVLLMVMGALPVNLLANPTDECPRVERYVARVQALAERAAPIITRSGNERAIALLRDAIGDIRSANMAVDSGRCRAGFNLAQQAETKIHRALRLVNRDRAD